MNRYGNGELLSASEINGINGNENGTYSGYDAGTTHAFIFTHAPIVGHGGKATHNEADGTDHDRPFVEWLNGYNNHHIEGIYVEAVFVGHTHENWIFCNVTTDNMNNPTGNDIVPSGIPLPFSWYALYIETTTATKLYG